MLALWCNTMVVLIQLLCLDGSCDKQAGDGVWCCPDHSHTSCFSCIETEQRSSYVELRWVCWTPMNPSGLSSPKIVTNSMQPMTLLRVKVSCSVGHHPLPTCVSAYQIVPTFQILPTGPNFLVLYKKTMSQYSPIPPHLWG